MATIEHIIDQDHYFNNGAYCVQFGDGDKYYVDRSFVFAEENDYLSFKKKYKKISKKEFKESIIVKNGIPQYPTNITKNVTNTDVLPKEKSKKVRKRSKTNKIIEDDIPEGIPVIMATPSPLMDSINVTDNDLQTNSIVGVVVSHINNNINNNNKNNNEIGLKKIANVPLTKDALLQLESSRIQYLMPVKYSFAPENNNSDNSNENSNNDNSINENIRSNSVPVVKVTVSLAKNTNETEFKCTINNNDNSYKDHNNNKDSNNNKSIRDLNDIDFQLFESVIKQHKIEHTPQVNIDNKSNNRNNSNDSNDSNNNNGESIKEINTIISNNNKTDIVCMELETNEKPNEDNKRKRIKEEEEQIEQEERTEQERDNKKIKTTVKYEQNSELNNNNSNNDSKQCYYCNNKYNNKSDTNIGKSMEDGYKSNWFCNNCNKKIISNYLIIIERLKEKYLNGTITYDDDTKIIEEKSSKTIIDTIIVK